MFALLLKQFIRNFVFNFQAFIYAQKNNSYQHFQKKKKPKNS